MGEGIDGSRHRIAGAIQERHEAGESIDSLANDYRLGNDAGPGRWPTHRYIVELVLAAGIEAFERGKAEGRAAERAEVLAFTYDKPTGEGLRKAIEAGEHSAAGDVLGDLKLVAKAEGRAEGLRHAYEACAGWIRDKQPGNAAASFQVAQAIVERDARVRAEPRCMMVCPHADQCRPISEIERLRQRVAELEKENAVVKEANSDLRAWHDGGLQAAHDEATARLTCETIRRRELEVERDDARKLEAESWERCQSYAAQCAALRERLLTAVIGVTERIAEGLGVDLIEDEGRWCAKPLEDSLVPGNAASGDTREEALVRVVHVAVMHARLDAAGADRIMAAMSEAEDIAAWYRERAKIKRDEAAASETVGARLARESEADMLEGEARSIENFAWRRNE